MTTRTETAEAAFLRVEAEALEALAEARDRIRDWGNRQKADPKNWGYVGTMARVRDLLREVSA